MRKHYTFSILFGILLLGFLLRFVSLSKMNLFVDEAYYWDWARHLSFGYYSHPPMVAWLIAAGRFLLGDTEFALRIPFVFLGVLTIISSYFLGKIFFDDLTGFILAAFVAFSPSYVLPARMAMPDQPIVLFWVLAMVFFWRGYKRGKILDWFLFGVFLGLGFLSKYQMIFLPVSIVIFLLLTKRGRKLFFDFRLYLSFLVSFLVFSPNLVWNFSHQLITFVFQLNFGIQRSFGEAFSPTSLFPNFFVFLKEAFLTPDIILKLSIFISLPVFIFSLFKKKREEFFFLFLTFILITIFFSLFNGKSHWFFPGAIGVLLILTASLSDFFQNKLLMYPAILVIFFFIILDLKATNNLTRSLIYGPLDPPFSKIRVYQMVFYDSFGWKDTVFELAARSNYSPDKDIFITQYYTIASELAFYLSDKPRVYSPNGQYLIWGKPQLDKRKIVLTYSPGEEAATVTRISRPIFIKQGNLDFFDWKLRVEGP